LFLLLLFLLLPACEQQQMAKQPSHRPLQPSAFFKDKRSAQPLVPGTVARGMLENEALESGARRPVAKQVQQAVAMLSGVGPPWAGLAAATAVEPYSNVFPQPLTKDFLHRGQERFNIFCSVCHDRAGTGEGIVWQRGYAKPPSFHIDRLRKAPAGYYFQVISSGFGAMPEYGSQIPPRDRWAIVAYVRALQLSQHASRGDVPAGTKLVEGRP
jgi:mono/diheme cytochrome c family protein